MASESKMFHFFRPHIILLMSGDVGGLSPETICSGADLSENVIFAGCRYN